MLTSINHITLAVQEIERSFSFYRDVLGLKPLVKWDCGAYFLVGDGKEELWFCLNVDDNRETSPCYTHYAFSVRQEDFKAICSKIMASGVTIFKENSSPGDSLYFLDPDGHKLEIHIENWRERIQKKKLEQGNWKDVEWFV